MLWVSFMSSCIRVYEIAAPFAFLNLFSKEGAGTLLGRKP